MFGFWIFVSVVYICDVIVYLKGHNGVIMKASSPHEIRLREATVLKAEGKVAND